MDPGPARRPELPDSDRTGDRGHRESGDVHRNRYTRRGVAVDLHDPAEPGGSRQLDYPRGGSDRARRLREHRDGLHGQCDRRDRHRREPVQERGPRGYDVRYGRVGSGYLRGLDDRPARTRVYARRDLRCGSDRGDEQPVQRRDDPVTSVEKPSSGRDAVDAARDDLRGLFELETLHRRGPASLVWLARDLEFDQPVALKLMPRTPGAGAEVEEAFHRAAALVAALDHPHVVPWYSAGATDRFFWCSMEYVEGRSLAELLRSSQPMAPSMCLRIVGQVANALDAAHRLGVVHAGLTPANVLIDAAGDARVTDFWVPWVLEQLGTFAADTDMTRKLAYRAPEQIAERLAGPEADQYALAALMQACLSGKLARETGSGVPPRVTRALERAMSPVPGDRLASVGEFVAAAPPTSSTGPARATRVGGPARAPAACAQPPCRGAGPPPRQRDPMGSGLRGRCPDRQHAPGRRVDLPWCASAAHRARRVPARWPRDPRGV